jgi:hypothetical protein
VTTTKQQATSLGQTEIWFDQRGNEHRIDEMSVRYKTNVLRMIERHAPRIVANAMVDALVAKLMSASSTVPCVDCDQRGITKPHEWEHGAWHGSGPVPGSEADQMFQYVLPEMPSMSTEEAVEMVRRTPLVARLIEDIAAGRGGTDGDAPVRPNGRPHLTECVTQTDSRAHCTCDDVAPTAPTEGEA